MRASNHGMTLRVNVGDFVSYMFGSVELVGIVMKVTKVTASVRGGPKPPEFTMKLLEIDGYVSDWDVWPSDSIVILSEARRPGQDQVLNHKDPVVPVRNHLKRGPRPRDRGQVFSGNST